jgi:hypothetical protein
MAGTGGVSREGILEAAKEDYQELIQVIGRCEARPPKTTGALNP